MVVNAIDFVVTVTAVYVYTVGQSLNVHSANMHAILEWCVV